MNNLRGLKLVVGLELPPRRCLVCVEWGLETRNPVEDGRRNAPALRLYERGVRQVHHLFQQYVWGLKNNLKLDIGSPTQTSTDQ